MGYGKRKTASGFVIATHQIVEAGLLAKTVCQSTSMYLNLRIREQPAPTVSQGADKNSAALHYLPIPLKAHRRTFFNHAR